MTEFLHAAVTHTFIQHALLAGLLSSVACGVVGTWVVVRRISAIAGSIAHCVLAGLGAARYLQVVHGWEWASPFLGAVVAAIAAALVIGAVTLRTKEREDTVIGALWAIGMAVGILFISRTPGYNEDLMSYLFGNILLVGRSDLWVMAILDAVVLLVGILLYTQLQAVCFDDEFARLRGINVEMYYILLLCLTAITVVLLVSVVGIVLVIALLTIPVAVATHFTTTLRGTMIVSALLCTAFTTAGLAISYAPDLPAGATTIVIAAGSYVLVLAGKAVLVKRRRG
jgi:zinc transport system permease protein